MKTLEQYIFEYRKAMKESLLREPNSNMIIRPTVWILFRWEEDVADGNVEDFNPWNENYTGRILEVEPNLQAVLLAGLQIVLDEMGTVVLKPDEREEAEKKSMELLLEAFPDYPNLREHQRMTQA